MFSIIIPTLNNLDYLRVCLNSLKKIQLLTMKLLYTLILDLMEQKSF